jgi:dGTPase
MAGVIDVAGRTYAPDLGADVLGGALERLLAADAVPSGFDGSRGDLARLKDMTSRLIGHFVLVVEQATRDRHGPGPLCRFEADLVVPDDLRAECSVLKAIANHFVMTTDVRLAVMAEQRDVVRDLVAAFASAPEERLDAPFRADHAAAGDDASRLRVVVDQVASLTDVRALALHRQWCR